MNVHPSARCPVCGFSFAWDGRECGHCPPPDRARRIWEQIKRFTGLVNPDRDITPQKACAIAAACLRRVWIALPEQGRAAIEALENGVCLNKSETAVRDVGEDPGLVPQVASVALKASELVGRGTQGNFAQAVADIAELCREVVGYRAFPPRALFTFPLPPDLEPYRPEAALRPAAATIPQAGSSWEVVASEPTDNDPVGERPSVAEMLPVCHAAFGRAASDQLNQQSQAYGGQRLGVVASEEAAQREIARDILGYPGAISTFDPSWRTSTAAALVRGMYASRDFSAMPILADALQDAGCDDPEVLGHCRGDQPHVRGCWVCTAVLSTQ